MERKHIPSRAALAAIAAATLLTASAHAPAATEDDATRMRSDMMNSGTALDGAGRADGGEVRVLVYGNSIALHGPMPSIGWTNNCGMAASAPEKDFAHLVVAGLEKRLGKKADFRIRNLAALERNFTTNVASVAEIAADAKWKPDYVVIAVGENVPNFDSSTAAAYSTFTAGFVITFASTTKTRSRPLTPNSRASGSSIASVKSSARSSESTYFIAFSEAPAAAAQATRAPERRRATARPRAPDRA